MSKTMTIKAKGSLILSAAAIGERDDKHLSPAEKAVVPYEYGEHLVADRFATEVVVKGKATRAETKAAHAALREAEARLAAAGDDPVIRAAAEQALAEAGAALDELQG
jgi:hypothetical protein